MEITAKILSKPIQRIKHCLPGERYFVPLRRGLSLGFYRSPDRDGGSWHARLFAGGTSYDKTRLGAADDAEWKADGQFILSFDQASDRALTWAAEKKSGVKNGPYSVADAIKAYVADLEARNGESPSVARTKLTIAKHITGKPIDRVQVKQLDYSHIHDWFTKLGSARKRRKGETKDEALQRGHATCNRILTNLKAALNLAHKSGHVCATGKPWERVSAYEGADAPTVNYLGVDEVKALRQHCSADFLPMFDAGLFTGARWGELCRLKVEDFNGSTLQIAPGKGKARHQPLTDEGKAFFAAVCAGRKLGEPVFVHLDGRNAGKAWEHSQQTHHMKTACKAAGIAPQGFHCATRHSFASALAKAKTPMHVIANLLGHAHNDVRLVTKHYAHLDADFVSDQLQANLPSFK